MGHRQEETKQGISKSCRFYVWMIGVGEGCDHYIACNERLRPLWAKTLDRAKEEVTAMVDEGIEDAVIIEAAHLHIFDIDACLAEAEAMQEQKAKEAKDASEKAEFERLKVKFGEAHEQLGSEVNSEEVHLGEA